MTATRTLAGVVQVLRDADLVLEVRGPEDTVVSGVSHDSRTVGPGDLFLAWRGYSADGHDFLESARRAGAAAAIVERPAPDVDLPQVVVRDGRHAAALAADTVLGHPAGRLEAVGITGTNGKSTTALLVRSILARAGRRAAVLGTLGAVGVDGKVLPGSEGLTTPDPVGLAVRLEALADQGAEVVVMEASSHALEQRRLEALRFRVAVFTNLTRDHLDFHGDLESYRQAKLRILDLLSQDGAVVVNDDDPAWDDVTSARSLRFSTDGGGDLRAANVLIRSHGSHFTLLFREDSAAVALPLAGRFNVENALAAAGVALVMGVDLETVADALGRVPQIPGRMEVVVSEPFTVLIDFAHTPAALENLLEAVTEFRPRRTVVLFGAGGDRDRGKRRPMAETVARFADRVFLTSDNPRTEDPESILDDLEPGLGTVDRVREADRAAAIRQAVLESREGDVLVLAGKGHETYQVVGRERRPLDERAEVKEAMRLRGAA